MRKKLNRSHTSCICFSFKHCQRTKADSIRYIFGACVRARHARDLSVLRIHCQLLLIVVISLRKFFVRSCPAWLVFRCMWITWKIVYDQIGKYPEQRAKWFYGQIRRRRSAYFHIYTYGLNLKVLICWQIISASHQHPLHLYKWS